MDIPLTIKFAGVCTHVYVCVSVHACMYACTCVHVWYHGINKVLYIDVHTKLGYYFVTRIL